MNIFGFNLSLTKAVPANLSPVHDNSRAWFPLVVHEPFTGAWQRNMELRPDTQISYAAVFRCITLISADVGKLRVKLVTQDRDGIWSEADNSAAFSPVLKRPNSFQTRIQFFENWMNSKLIHGNTYVLKERDERGVVVALHILDPQRVKPLVAPDGSVFYELRRDDLAQVPENAEFAPASEIIHDRCNALFHPLVGLSPLFAAGLAAGLGVKIQSNSTDFFANGARPGGILTAPGHIDEETAKRLKADWENKFSGVNAGKTAVLGDGLTYQPMIMTSRDAQMIEQLRWTAELVCMAFGVPAWKIGAAPLPALNNVETSARSYYSDCLQTHLEHIEELLDYALGLNTKKDGIQYGTEFDLANLFRTDSSTQYTTISTGIRGGFLTPNEGRRSIDLKPIKGGDTVYLQEQDHSLQALAERDAGEDPFGTAKPPAPEPPAAADDAANDNEAQAAKALDVIEKRLANVRW